MALPHYHVRLKILAKIRIYILSRDKLLCSLCHEIPCTKHESSQPDICSPILMNNFVNFALQEIKSLKTALVQERELSRRSENHFRNVITELHQKYLQNGKVLSEQLIHRCEIFGFFSPLILSKWEKNVFVLLSFYTFWGKCIYFSIFGWKLGRIQDEWPR